MGRDASGLRGAVAARDFAAGDLIARLPVNTSIRLSKTDVFPPEHAYELLVRM